jgi:PAS domain S-box-containing protein
MLNSVPLLVQSESISEIVYQPIVVTPDLTVMDAILHLSGAAKLPSQSCASCVLIVEDGHLVGILTQADIFRLIAAQQDLGKLAIRDVMTANPVTIGAADFTDLHVAIDLLDRHQIRHLPVVDDRHCLLGILTSEQLQHHLAEALTTNVLQLEAEKAGTIHQLLLLDLDSAEVVSQQAKLTLKESQQFLQTVIETFPLAVFWKDRESRFLGCNHNFAQDANLRSPAEIIGKTDYDLPWGIDEAASYRTDDRQVIDSGVPKLGIIETQTQADGTSIWLETNKLPLRNLDGETIGILGTYQDVTDRQQAAAQLNRLSERLSLSLKSGSLGCWEWDILKDCLIWDDRMYELYGAKKSSTSEAYAIWVSSLHPDDRAMTESKLAQALLGTAEFDTEFRVIHPDGSIHFIKAYGLVKRDNLDRPNSIIGINFDITAAKHDEVIRHQTEQTIRQQAEMESVLREITQRIRQSLDLPIVFETAVAEIRAFMKTDRVGIFKFQSDFNFDDGKFVAESVGSGFEPILGVKIHDPGFGEKLARHYQKGKINIVEDIYTAGLLDGEIQILANFQVQANLVVPLLNGPKLWGLLCIHHCSAHRSWQEIELNFINHIAEQIGIGIQQATLYEKVQSELEIRWRAEEQLQAELTERQQVEIQLRQSNQELAHATRLKDEFLASMSHELRTPLNAILGMSEALQASAFGPIADRQRNSIATIERSGKHLLTLINNILDLSNIEADRFDLELTDVSIQSLCQHSLLSIEELAHKRQIRVQIQLPESLQHISIRADDLRCHQVLINLLSNAVKFTPEGGSVTLDVRVVGELGCEGDAEDISSVGQHSLTQTPWQIIFSVIDTGIGIAAENMDKLFQSFVQIDSSLSRQYAGTGLGLALVKRIVEMHGGTISVQSTVNRGSCFRVSLPFDPRAEIVVPPSLSPLVYPLPPATHTPAIRPKALIFVVEDNEANMETMTGYLKSRGYSLMEAVNGQQAISILEDCTNNDRVQIDCPDIILMDIQMPGMDGFETIRRIRQIPDCDQMPIVALTALAMPTDRQKCLDAGANEYVTKPVKLGQLVSTIETLLVRK